MRDEKQTCETALDTLIARVREAGHRIAHFFGINTGRVETFWLDGDLWIGFRCGGCDEINHAHRRAVLMAKKESGK